MNYLWEYLILFFVGAMLCDFSFDCIYIYKFFGDDLNNIPNRVFYVFHFMGLAMAIMMMFRLYESVTKEMGWKPCGVKVDFSYFRALKMQILHVLTKLKGFIQL